jgi:hypothetical protein
VNGAARLTPTTTPATPAAGDLFFDSAASNALKFYDGSAWQTVGTGTGSGDFKKDGSVAMTGNFNAGGNSVLGNTTASANLKLESTSDATKGYVLIQPNGGNVGIGTTSPGSFTLNVMGSCNGSGCGILSQNSFAGSGAAGVVQVGADSWTGGVYGHTSSIYDMSASPTGSFPDVPASSTYISDIGNGLTLLASWPGANSNIKFYTNGAAASNERMRIDNNGNVGIGTTAPARLLHVNGAARLTPTTTPASPAAGDLFFDSAASNALKFYDGSAWQTVGTGSSSGDFMKNGSVTMTGNLKLGANYISNDGGASEGLAFDTSGNANFTGNVGIGTTTPAGYGAGGPILGLRGTASTLPEISLDATPFGGSNWVTVSDNNGNFYFRNVTTNNTPVTLHSNSTVDIDKIAVGSYAGTAPPSDGMIVPGNVGIGTDTPARLLHVNGAARFTPTTTPATPAAGDLFFDSAASNALKFYDGAAWQTVGTGTGSGDFMKNGSVTMTGNLKLGTNYISNDGGASEGLAFDTSGNANFTGNVDGDGYINAAKLSATRADATIYSATSASLGNPNGSIVNSWNTYADDGVASTFVMTANNASSKSQNAYFAAVSNAGAANYTPTIVIGQQTGATTYAERMRIDSAGNVGIGTDTPARLLHVNGAARLTPTTTPASPAAGDLFFDSAASNALKFYDGSAWQTVGTGTGTGDFKKDGSVAMTGNLKLGANYISNDGGASEGLAFDTSGNANFTGNLGIGTASPSYALQIEGWTGEAGIFSDSSSRAAQVHFGYNAPNPIGSVGYNGSTMDISTAAFGGDLTLGTDANERMRITSGGNVGIGTDTPARLLHVNGAARLTPTTTPASPAAGDLFFDSAASNALKFYDGSAWQTVGTGSSGGDFKKDGSVAMTGNFNAGGNSVLGNTTASANLTLESTSDATKGYVNIQPNGGNVGIGTTTPAAKLDVVGTVKATAVDTPSILSSGVETLRVNTVASGVNYLTVAAGTTGNGPILSTSGTDAVVPLNVYTKGGGSILLAPGQAPAFKVNFTSSAVNYIQVQGAATGNAPSFTAGGTDTNVDIKLVPKGTGNTVFTSGNVGIGTTSPNATLQVSGNVNRTTEYIASSVNSGTALTLSSISTTGGSYQVTLTGNATITLPADPGVTNGVAQLTVVITQDATGSRTLSWSPPAGDTLLWSGGVTPSVCSSASQITIYQFIKVNGVSNWYGAQVWRQCP